MARVTLIDKLRERAKLLLSINCTPRDMARSAALGMIIGISPYVGLQTYIAVAVASFCKLPVYPMLIGVYLTNPITIPFIFTLTTKFGMWVLRMDYEIAFDWSTVTISGLLEAGKVLLLPFVIGTHLAGILLAIVTYFIVYLIARKTKLKNNKSEEE